MALKKQDLEVILDSVVALIKSKYNSKLTSISSEKSDSVPLPAITTSVDANGVNDGIAILDLNTKVINADPFVILICSDIKSLGERGLTAHNVSLSVLVVKADAGENHDIHRTMLRYMRAMEEIFEENFDALDTGSKYIIESLAPKSLGELNSSKTFRGAGVALTFQYS